MTVNFNVNNRLIDSFTKYYAVHLAVDDVAKYKLIAYTVE